MAAKSSKTMICRIGDAEATNVGRRRAGSKKRIRFRYTCAVPKDGEHSTGAARSMYNHEVVLSWSLSSGKAVVHHDGIEVVFNKTNGGASVLDVSWKEPAGGGGRCDGEREFRLVCCRTTPAGSAEGFRKYELLIDGVPLIRFPSETEDGKVDVRDHDRSSSLLPRSILDVLFPDGKYDGVTVDSSFECEGDLEYDASNGSDEDGYVGGFMSGEEEEDGPAANGYQGAIMSDEEDNNLLSLNNSDQTPTSNEVASGALDISAVDHPFVPLHDSEPLNALAPAFPPSAPAANDLLGTFGGLSIADGRAATSEYGADLFSMSKGEDSQSPAISLNQPLDEVECTNQAQIGAISGSLSQDPFAIFDKSQQPDGLTKVTGGPATGTGRQQHNGDRTNGSDNATAPLPQDTKSPTPAAVGSMEDPFAVFG